MSINTEKKSFSNVCSPNSDWKSEVINDKDLQELLPWEKFVRERKLNSKCACVYTTGWVLRSNVLGRQLTAQHRVLMAGIGLAVADNR